ncbi:MAG TPA: hypothetical protein VFK43_18250, partial [Acidimicrobiales bacterium]|nr:hypothetical protein [Acidimicrobiales bacterium]
ARRLAGTPRRFTWRVAAFLLIVLGVLGAGAAAIWQSARGTYFVAFDDTGHVAVFRGQPDGVLWIDPELVRTTEFTRDQVRPNLRDELDAGLVLDSKAEALAFPATATTTTTSTSTTSTTTTSTTTTAPLAPAPVTPSSVP